MAGRRDGGTEGRRARACARNERPEVGVETDQGVYRNIAFLLSSLKPSCVARWVAHGSLGSIVGARERGGKLARCKQRRDSSEDWAVVRSWTVAQGSCC